MSICGCTSNTLSTVCLQKQHILREKNVPVTVGCLSVCYADQRESILQMLIFTVCSASDFSQQVQSF